mgnify:CR=1 FL=1
MTPELLPLPLAVVAFLYALVGHGGASGYLALMGIAGVPPQEMKVMALSMNLCVSAIAGLQYAGAGHFRWALLRPFIITSVPCAFLGAGIKLDDALYLQLLGACVAVAGLRLVGLVRARPTISAQVPVLPSLAIGAGIGLLSGMLGIGGGILLSPVLLLAGWADARTAAATSAFFILVNSAAGLLKVPDPLAGMPDGPTLWTGAAVLGGLAGSWLGARRSPEPRLRQALGMVLLLASVKLLWP